MSETRAIVEAFFAKSSENDLSIVDLFAAEFEFFVPGDPKHFPWSGRHTCAAELAAVFHSIWSYSVPGKALIQSATLIVEGEQAAWIGIGISQEISQVSPAAGERYTIDVALHFTVRAGRIVRLYAIEDMTALAQRYRFSQLAAMHVTTRIAGCTQPHFRSIDAETTK